MSLEGLQIGRYRFLHLLGSGGMGEVYLAEDARIDQKVAIKVIRTEVSSYPNAEATKEATRLFEREAKAIAKLDHPNILPLFDFGEANVNNATLTYMVMLYRQEGSLADWLRQRGGSALLAPQDIEHFIHQAAEALQHAHDRQILHQDVKPPNFLIRNRKEYPTRPDLLLADFGVAKLTSATSSASATIRGTPAYMAPEQWSGEPVAATDQYALAVMAYELLTGRTPFQGRLEQMMYQHFHVQPPPPSTLNPRLPKDVDMVLLHALAKKPEERFASVSAFARAFWQALLSAPTVSVPTPPPSPLIKDIPGTPSSGNDIRTTLTISKIEAFNGTSRTLNLPGGRQTRVSVPAGAYDGQVIRHEGLGEPSSSSGSAGALILTLAVQQAEEPDLASYAGSSEKTARASNPNLQTPTIPASNPHIQDSTILASNQPPSIAAPFPPNQVVTRRPGLSKGKTILLIGVALLVIVASIGIFSVVRSNQIATDNANATGTTQANATAQTNATTVAVNATGTAEANAVPTYVANATATATALQDLYNSATGGTPALSDPLRDNSNGNGWNEGTNSVGGTCAFSGGAYHVSDTGTNSFEACDATSTDFSNFAYQVQMKIIKGDEGGVVFRVNYTNNTFVGYVFAVGQNGSYLLFVCPPNANICNSPLLNSSSGAIKQGLNQTNLITVVVKGNTITLYVNRQEIDSVTDSTLSHGQIGVVAYDNPNPTDVVYSNAEVWTL